MCRERVIGRSYSPQSALSWLVGGKLSHLYIGPGKEENRFHPVAVPAGFVPDHIMHVNWTVILSMGDRQMISGFNHDGLLGLGHDDELTGFEELPFRVDRVVPADSFNVFFSGRQLLFAGEVPKTIAQSGLPPGYDADEECVAATPLRFPERVKGFFCDDYLLVWVTEGRTHLHDGDAQYSVLFEAKALSKTAVSLCRKSTDMWFRVTGVSSGVAKLVECEAPDDCDIFAILSVDLDAWEGGA
ncbi:hypothetical protein J8273_1083 [Carpediemonas membranifera]|uniref:Uncharacterized protein n=1 Tax=Carpediemonas membranifera TaxID=201153 RepID=A0A8J6B9U4_9EUKA|nr:hypothetical protein J8273_1083 [Carpediemonas membranifera]|eukprot:KAG9397174.1 hypothetical protein J8273_1083 [Carpediemonas membranifera]